MTFKKLCQAFVMLWGVVWLAAFAQAQTTAPKTLTVGIYPYVPRPAQFQEVIAAQWKKIAPDIQLNFVADSIWDGGYYIDPPKGVDVFVFDAIFMEYFKSKGVLEPLQKSEIDHFDDLLSYASEGVYSNQQYYGIPQIGGGGILFYRKGDKALKKAKGFTGIQQVLGQCSYPDTFPPKNQGLILDLSGRTTNFCTYVEVLEDRSGVYTPNPPLPQNEQALSPIIVKRLRNLVRLGNDKQAQYDDATNKRPKAFASGLGRAMIGYTERMAYMTNDALKNIRFRLMPFSSAKKDVHLFYSDIVGINPAVKDKQMRAAAVKLANLMASKEVMVGSILSTSKQQQLQYLLPVRHSVFKALAKKDPFKIYKKLYKLVKRNQPKLFKLGTDSRKLTTAMGKVIRTKVFEKKLCD